ncbi:LONG-CHAIN-ALCOHOL OXIDASE FAO4B [Salix koriyanagi]|uniref:LONG-CHAIN-ALCOHOL OXIDASE FAO4B n=1 Tax=Salix koriyanagi TaxID=2511006 RepID=A0A9Q0TGD0_9ROSI|nr:LONG-CHAIN-ALCOHOL OXIDASE FAO4B [Salix koriyanagi]
MDRENLKMGFRKALPILIAAGAVEVGTYRIDGQIRVCEGVSRKDLEEFLDTITIPGWAEVKGRELDPIIFCTSKGGCRMGATAEEGGADQNGESWEAENLLVCDGSALPGAIGVNPMTTIQSTADCI